MKKNAWVKLVLIGWVGVIASTYNACGGFKAYDGSLGINAVPAFKKTLHPILVENCGACHGESQAPLFSSIDIDAAYEQAKTSINMGNPLGSRLVQRLVAENHQCWSNCEDNGKEMLAAIEEFKKLVGGQAPDLRISLGAVPIPGQGGLPAADSGTATTLTWPLDNVGMPGGTFTIDAQELGPGVYRFHNPILHNLSKNMKVHALTFKLNGASRDRENTYGAIAIDDTELSTRQISGAPMSVVMEVDEEGLPIGADLEAMFDVIEPIETTPRSTPTFSQLLPIFTNNCNGCHSVAGGNQGDRNFESLAGINTVPRVPDAAGNIDPGDPGIPNYIAGNFVDSLMYQAVSRAPGTAKFMPANGTTQIPQANIDLMIDWIMGGARP